MTKGLICSFLFSFMLFFSYAQKGINCDLIIENNDVSITNYSASPGDTLCIVAGIRPHLYLRDIVGTEEKPVVLINYGGEVHIESFQNYGLRFANSSHVRITGTGEPDEFYGIKIDTVSNGDGIDINFKSTNFEIDHIELQGIKYAGIKVKTDPDCTFSAVRDSFTMYNIHIHDNYIHNIGNEGMYVGNSFFLGKYLSACDTTVLPHIIDGVEIYNNRLENIGWDGIQVGCALNACNIYNNSILHDSYEEVSYQMSGIMVNTGSRCDVFNNKIVDGKGTGIINQGAGGQLFYNNLIVNAGRDYYFEDQILKQQFGIYSKYMYMHPDETSNYFINNTIINPKSDGIRYYNSESSSNKILNNLIINPGAYIYYDTNGSVNNSGEDSYIHNYLHESDLQMSNNIMERNSKNQFFVDTSAYNFHLTAKSPAFNMGIDISDYHIITDLDGEIRPYDRYYDIGAYELQSAENISELEEEKQELYPNPINDVIKLKLSESWHGTLDYIIFNSEGYSVLHSESQKISQSQLIIPAENLNPGIYYLKIFNHKESMVYKFVKL